MRIRPPERIQRGDKVEYRVEVQAPGYPETLWYRVDEEYGNLVSSRTDAALVALLIPAMKAGEKVQVAGTISERLYYNLSRPYQAVIREVHPSLKKIDIHAEDVRPASTSASGVATGFSAGIDSFSVLADHHYADDVPKRFRLTHLLYNNVGSHNQGGERLFRKRFERIRPAAEQIGLPFIAVNSNVGEFYRDQFRFSQTHTPRNASVALLLQRNINRFLYGSAYHYRSIYIGSDGTMGNSDPITLPLLSTRGLDALTVGSAYTRVEKTLQVANVEHSYRALDVCIRDDTAKNCSTCRKCRRTMLTLEIAGMLDRYEDVFDLEAYRRGREKYIAKVIQSSSPFAREIVSFARDHDFTFPLSSRLKAPLFKIKNKVSWPQPVRDTKRLVRWMLPNRTVNKTKKYQRDP